MLGRRVHHDLGIGQSHVPARHHFIKELCNDLGLGFAHSRVSLETACGALVGLRDEVIFERVEARLEILVHSQSSTILWQMQGIGCSGWQVLDLVIHPIASAKGLELKLG